MQNNSFKIEYFIIRFKNRTRKCISNIKNDIVYTYYA